MAIGDKIWKFVGKLVRRVYGAPLSIFFKNIFMTQLTSLRNGQELKSL